MRIDSVRISGFRGISELEVELSRVTLLLGINNAGKTSVIKALQLALGDYAKHLQQEDFHIQADDSPSEQITVDVRMIPTAEDDQRASQFSIDCLDEFGDHIQAEANGDQFFAMRTTCRPDMIRGGYRVERFSLETWPEFSRWLETVPRSHRRIRRLFDSIICIPVDAQRDIHKELKEKYSFISKVLSSVNYDEKVEKTIEQMIAEINQETLDQSESLKLLKQHLDTMNQSFSDTGRTEITPFPRKIRDLAKQYTIHYGEKDTNSFSMEYHGMGTRSWASMLTVKALIDVFEHSFRRESALFFPVLAAEEPEAHLHPAAQRLLYTQLVGIQGQIIISTHSPFIVGMTDIRNIRNLRRTDGVVHVYQIPAGLPIEVLKRMHREILLSRGELLFARMVVLVEGLTEEQLIPAMFERAYGFSMFAKGIMCLGVGGDRNYTVFLRMCCSLGIPVCIIGDNDGDSRQKVEKQIHTCTQSDCVNTYPAQIGPFFLSEGNAMEQELYYTLDIKDELRSAVVRMLTQDLDNERYVSVKTKEIERLSDAEFVKLLIKEKTSYASHVADMIRDESTGMKPVQLIPETVLKAFSHIEEKLIL
ncbi:MAG: AAA family ATPase [Spirochaetia bacterium]|nr:AAA family ATPase [Spirochaetia bacterium]